MKQIKELQVATLDYYREHGRHTLPWRMDTSPYSIMISEVMLQQTQVSRVLSKYAEFMADLPSFKALANASQVEVLKLWQGLGYNRRALRLKQSAELVTRDYGGVLPKDPLELQKLPGIGPNTAGSIAAFAYNLPTVFIETNIRRVFIHHCFVDKQSVSDVELKPLIAESLAGQQPREWYWALMDYGSYLVSQVSNPNQRSKHYTKQSKFLGSDRQIRGEILRLLLGQTMDREALLLGLEHLETDEYRIKTILDGLVVEGFITNQKNLYKIA